MRKMIALLLLVCASCSSSVDLPANPAIDPAAPYRTALNNIRAAVECPTTAPVAMRTDLILQVPCTWTSDAATLCMHPDILRGWDYYIPIHVEPEIASMAAHGFRPRFIVHLPYGAIPGEEYWLDMRKDAERLNLPMTKRFVEAWKKVCGRKVIVVGQETTVEVIFYVGHPRRVTTFGKMLVGGGREGEIKRGMADDYSERWRYSIRQIIDAGGSIAFDAAGAWPVGSVQYEAMDQARAEARANGARAYSEPRPHKDFPQYADWPVISTEGFWHESDPVKTPGAAFWAMPTAQITGEICRWPIIPSGGGWVGPGPEVAGRLLGDVRVIWKDGHTAIAAACFRVNGVSIPRRRRFGVRRERLRAAA